MTGPEIVDGDGRAQAAQGLQSTLAGYQQQGAQLGYTQQQNALNQQLAQLGQTGEQVGYKGQQEQYANAQQQLKTQAQAAGIPVQQATSQLAQGLSALGISTDPTQYLAQASTAEASAAGGYAGVLSAAGVLGGLGPQTFTGG